MCHAVTRLHARGDPPSARDASVDRRAALLGLAGRLERARVLAASSTSSPEGPRCGPRARRSGSTSDERPAPPPEARGVRAARGGGRGRRRRRPSRARARPPVGDARRRRRRALPRGHLVKTRETRCSASLSRPLFTTRAGGETAVSCAVSALHCLLVRRHRRRVCGSRKTPRRARRRQLPRPLVGRGVVVRV